MLNRGTVRDSKQNSKMSQENRRERTPVRSRTRTAIPTIGSSDTKRDLTVSSFMLALVLVGVVIAAHTNHPVFWLLIGPTAFAVLHTTRTFLRQRVIRREGPLMFCKRDRLYQETLLTKITNRSTQLSSAYIRGRNSSAAQSFLRTHRFLNVLGL